MKTGILPFDWILLQVITLKHANIFYKSFVMLWKLLEFYAQY